MIDADSSPQGLYKDWMKNPNQEIWIIDETKYPVGPQHKEHSEIIVFALVRFHADKLTDYMYDIDEARRALPVDNNKSFKSGDLSWALQQSEAQPEYAQFVDIIAKALVECRDIILLVTSHKNIKSDPHTGKIKSVAEDGQSRVNRSKQLNLVNSLIISLMEKWFIKESVDIVIDRSEAFGLDPQQEGIRKDQIRVHHGSLKAGSPEIRMIAADDQGVSFRDVLLLPDYFGYLVRRYGQTNIDHAITDVLSEKVPFYSVPFDLPAMIAAVRATEKKA